MANMTFKTNLLPNSDLEYSLGSTTAQWNIYGNLIGTANYALQSNTADNAIHAGSATYATTAGNATDSTKVAKVGDTMTGSLTLSNGSITVSAGNIIAGVNGSTSAERQIRVQSGAG